MKRKHDGNSAGWLLVLVGGAILLDFIGKHSVAFLVILMIAIAGACWWWAKKKEKESSPVWTVNPEEPVPEKWPNEEIRAHLKAMRKAITKLLDEHKDLLDCLIFIGKSDGRLSDKEVEVLAEICTDLAEYKKIPIYRFDTLFRDIKKIKTEEFESAVSRVKMKGTQEMRLLSIGAERIIQTQKALSPGEAYCTEVISRIFTESGNHE